MKLREGIVHESVRPHHQHGEGGGGGGLRLLPPGQPTPALLGAGSFQRGECILVRSAIVMTVVGCLLLSGQPVQGQQPNKETELLKKELELAKKECELARRENDALRKENEQLKKEIEQVKKAAEKKDGADAKADKDEKPSATVDGVKYVVDSVTRNGSRVTLHILATNSKADCMILPPHAEAVDTEGNLYTSAPSRIMGSRLRLREGVKTRLMSSLPMFPPRPRNSAGWRFRGLPAWAPWVSE